MSFFDFISYPYYYRVDALNLGIYRFCVFSFFAFWQLINLSDFKLLLEKTEINNRKKKENFFSKISNEKLLYFSILFSILSAIGIGGNISIILFSICFFNIIKKIKFFISSTGEVIFRAMMLFLFFSPCTFSFSIDCFIFTGNFINNEKILLPGASILSIQYMMILLYAYASFAKINDKQWLAGEVMYTATNSPIYGKRNLPCKILDNKTIKIFASRLIIYYQFFGILFLPFEDVKMYYAVVGIFIHLGMAATMHLGYFPYVTILALLSFLL